MPVYSEKNSITQFIIALFSRHGLVACSSEFQIKISGFKTQLVSKYIDVFQETRPKHKGLMQNQYADRKLKRSALATTQLLYKKRWWLCCMALHFLSNLFFTNVKIFYSFCFLLVCHR